ncbi:MAG: ATP-dependent zinc protease [Porticoccaceae bacterium]
MTKIVTPELPPMATTAGKLHLPIVGAVEMVRIEPADLMLEARIDTGAETTSIHAEDIQLVENDGRRYVRFMLIDGANGEQVQQELRLRRRVLIKQSYGPDERRYVVRMWLTLGDTRSRVDVNLSDRTNFEYPLLIGRNFLTDSLIVDVSRHHALSN